MIRSRGRSIAVLFSLALAACGGGGGGGTPVTPPAAPAGLTYATPTASYDTQALIAPNAPSSTGGAIDTYAIAPPLPAGLALNAGTGVITGTPTAITAAANYTITATNVTGFTQATVNVAVVPGSESLVAMPVAAMTDADIKYFLGRTYFGGTTADFNLCKAQTVPNFVDNIVTFTPNMDPTLEAAADALLAHPATDNPLYPGKYPNQSDLALRSVYLLLHTTHPFQEVLAMFWHDHFAASDINLEGGSLYWMKTHMDLWRNEGNGNLRTLLLDMARDWVMLDWLSGLDSTKTNPNENFAREFWELFSLGVDNGYTQADITVAARAWTGWRRRFDIPVGSNLTVAQFDTTLHDPNSKAFFGQTIAAQNVTDDYQAVVDITVDHKPVAEFICKKLWEYFCYQAPSAALQSALAATLRANSYDLKATLKQILKSEGFFSAKSKAGQVKSPVEFAVGLIRSTNLQIPLGNLTGELNSTGEVPTLPPTVNGWPDNLGWLSAQAMLDRANIALDVITQRSFQSGLGMTNAALAANLLPGVTTSSQAVDALATLLNVTLTPTEKATYMNYLDTQPQAGGTTTPDPFNIATDVDDRVRGLIYELAQHPTYQVR